MSKDPRARVGWIFVGLYCAAMALLAAFVFRPHAGDMSGILFAYATLPWSYIGNQVSWSWGLGIGALGGAILNGVIAYWLGYGLAALWLRWCPSSSGAPSRR